MHGRNSKVTVVLQRRMPHIYKIKEEKETTH